MNYSMTMSLELIVDHNGVNGSGKNKGKKNKMKLL